MNKEPIGLYIFRFFMGFGLFAFMAMLYWSSVLLEEEVHDVQAGLSEIKSELFILRGEMNKTRDDVIHGLMDNNRTSEGDDSKQPATKSPLLSQSRRNSTHYPKMDASAPNLLEEDPFYKTTLPKLLGDNFKPQGLFHQAAIGRPANLHPFSNWANVAGWHEQCSVGVATLQFGKYETFAPDMAVKVELRHRASDGAVEYWVFLRDHVYWQPLTKEMFSESINMAPHFLRKHKVTAHDFKFYYDAIMNPYVQESGAVSLRTYMNDLEEITVIDDLTFVARWKTETITTSDGKKEQRAKYISKQMTGGLRPLASFVYKYFPNGEKIIDDDQDPETYRTSSVWAQNFQQHWARNIIPSCGPWVFQSMTDREIRFRRNADFYRPYAVLVEGLVEQFKDTPDAVWQDFKADKLDLYALQPEQVIELSNFMKSSQYKQQESAGDGISKLEYLARSYSYIGWNQAKHFFKSKKVRQALTLAIDRDRIVQQYLNGLGVVINGPFYPFSPSYDKSLKPWPFNLEAARRLLREEGWYDSDGDGIIDKKIGDRLVPFQFSLTYYVKNPTTKAVVEYIATTLKEIGIVCNLNGVDIADLSASFDDKSFDALVLGWSLGSPPEELRQLWFSAGAKEKGSSNAIGFANTEVDEIIDKLDYTFEEAERIKLYYRFGKIIYDECPYTFLYSPKAVLLYRNYLQNVWIPAERQDLVPGANVAEPNASIYWIKKHA